MNKIRYTTTTKVVETIKKKREREILALKNMMTIPKNSKESFNSRINQAAEKN